MTKNNRLFCISRVLNTCPVLFGVATIENSYGEVADIGVFAPQAIESQEKAFLARAREITPTIISLALERGKTLLIMPNDREAMALAMKCVGLTSPHKQKIMRIQNTLALTEVEVSETYLEAIKGHPRLEMINPAQPMTFGPDGYFFPFTPKHVSQKM